MKLGIAEILKQVDSVSTKAEKIEILQKNNSVPLQTILKYALDPNIVWALPKGDPPYTKNPYTDQQTNLYSEARRLYLFIEGGHPTLSQSKREMLFIQFLENLDKDDAKVILSIKNKKVPAKGVTLKFVQEVFPGLIE